MFVDGSHGQRGHLGGRKALGRTLSRWAGMVSMMSGVLGKMRGPRELGFYIALDGHVLEAALEIRDGPDP